MKRSRRHNCEKGWLRWVRSRSLKIRSRNWEVRCCIDERKVGSHWWKRQSDSIRRHRGWPGPMRGPSKEPLYSAAECPHNIVADFFQTEQSGKENKEETEVSFMTHSPKLPAFTSASLYSLKNESPSPAPSQDQGKKPPPLAERNIKEFLATG